MHELDGCYSARQLDLYRKFSVFGCTNLTSLSIPNSVTAVGENAFENCTSLEYNEYGNAYYLGNSENLCVVFVKVKFADITMCTLNENTKIIYDNAFKGCEHLVALTLPSGLRQIGCRAFVGCVRLFNMTVPSSVEIIRDYAFDGCHNLTIACEAEKAPEGWSDYWNYTNCNVEWGYKG